jgi:hypothetical protein
LTAAESELQQRGFRYRVTEPGEAYERDLYTCTIETVPPISALGETREEAIQFALERLRASEGARSDSRAGIALGLLIAAIVTGFIAYDYFAGGVPDEEPAPVNVPIGKKQRIRDPYRQRQSVGAPLNA